MRCVYARYGEHSKAAVAPLRRWHFRTDGYLLYSRFPPFLRTTSLPLLPHLYFSRSPGSLGARSLDIISHVTLIFESSRYVDCIRAMRRRQAIFHPSLSLFLFLYSAASYNAYFYCHPLMLLQSRASLSYFSASRGNNTPLRSATQRHLLLSLSFCRFDLNTPLLRSYIPTFDSRL